MFVKYAASRNIWVRATKAPSHLNDKCKLLKATGPRGPQKYNMTDSLYVSSSCGKNSSSFLTRDLLTEVKKNPRPQMDVEIKLFIHTG